MAVYTGVNGSTITSLEASGASSLTFSPDGTRLYVAKSSGTIDVFNPVTHSLITSWNIGSSLGGISLSPDGASLLAADGQSFSSVYRIDTATGNFVTANITLPTFPGQPQYPISDIAFTGPLSAILSGTGVWGYDTHNTISTIYNSSGGTYSNSAGTVLVHDNYLTLLADPGGSSGELFLYDDRVGSIVAAGSSYGFLNSGGPTGFNFGSQALSEKAGLVAQFIYYNSINFYDLSLNPVMTKQIAEPVAGLAFSPEGAYLYVYLVSGSLLKYNIQSWQVVDQFQVNPASHYSLSVYGDQIHVTPDGSYIAVTNSPTGSVQLIDLSSRNETFNGTAGADTFSGLDGNDTYIVNHSGDAVIENYAEGHDTVKTTLSAYGLTANVEDLIYLATSGFTGTGNSLDNVIDASSATSSAILTGGAGNDAVMGGAGNDTLDGGTGIDAMTGGAGDDIYYVDDANDTVVEAVNSSGNDTVHVTAATAVDLNGWHNSPFLGGNNSYVLGDGDDSLLIDAALSNSYVYVTADGGAGNDVLTVSGSYSGLSLQYATNFETINISSNAAAGVYQGIAVGNASVVNLTAAAHVLLGIGHVDTLNITAPLVDMGSGLSITTIGDINNGNSDLGLSVNDQIQVTGTVFLNGGDDTYYRRSVNGNYISPQLVDGGIGYDTLIFLPHGIVGGQYGIGSLDVDLQYYKNFEVLTDGNTGGGIGSSYMTFTHADGFNVISFIDRTVNLISSNSPNAIVEGGTANLHVSSDSIFGRFAPYGAENSSWDSYAELALQHSPSTSNFHGTHLVNNGTFLGDVQLSIMDDYLDTTNGHIGGIIYGYAGNDTILGSALGDTIYGGFDDDYVSGAVGNDYLDGGDGNDTLDGGDGNDFLDGGDGIDFLDGGDGFDVLIGTAPVLGYTPPPLSVLRDTYSGGTGFDTIRMSDSPLNFQITQTGTNLGLFLAAAQISSIEMIDFASTIGEERLITIGEPQIGGGGFATNLSLMGGLGRDTLVITAQVGGDYSMPTFIEYNWDISTAPNQGDQIIFSAAGQESYTIRANNTHFGYETIKGGLINDTLIGGDRDDILYGNSGDDIITGGFGNDVIDGGLGSDTLDGGYGNDRIYWDPADNSANISGGAGTDRLVLSTGVADPVGFDLYAHSLEYLERETLDSGNAYSWASISDIYTAGTNLKTEQFIYNDDGSWVYTNIDESVQSSCDRS